MAPAFAVGAPILNVKKAEIELSERPLLLPRVP